MLFHCCLSGQEKERAVVERMWQRRYKKSNGMLWSKQINRIISSVISFDLRAFISGTLTFTSSSGWLGVQLSDPLTSQCYVPRGVKWWALATVIRPLWLIKYFLWYSCWPDKTLKKRKNLCNSFAARQWPHLCSYGVVMWNCSYVPSMQIEKTKYVFSTRLKWV